MSFPSFLLMACLLSVNGLAQITISGEVTDEANGKPLAGASAYINNSTIGANTNEKGQFKLTGIKPGKYDLIISYLGYESSGYTIEAGNQDLKISFSLQRKREELEEILIVAPNLRKEWLQTFRENFLGLTTAASKTKILNEEEIVFEKTSDPKIVKAHSRVPLEIENRELGYRIYFDLKAFSYDYEQGFTSFIGYSRFEELRISNQKHLNRYLKIRDHCFRGSTLHFFKSLLNHDLSEQGFEIYFLREASNSGEDSEHSVGKPGELFQKKTALPRLAVPAKENEILFTSPLNRKNYLQWNGTLVVRYNKDPYYKNALKSRIIMEGDLPRGFQSFIRLKNSPAWLDENGVIEDPLDLEFSGFWIYEKLANMLPIDFLPSE